METCAPTRRSPRSIERLCDGVLHPGFTTEHTAILLSLAHCTGWSAERIAHQVARITGINLNAEQVFNFHRHWIRKRNDEFLSMEGFEIAQVLLRGIGVELLTRGRPLNETTYPKTVHFAKSWKPKSFHNRQLFPGYTDEVREHSRIYLAEQKESACGKLTPMEETLASDFGTSMAQIIRDIMKRWALAMHTKLRESPELRPIRNKDQVAIIMAFLKEFQDKYESEFGKMEDSVAGPLGEIKENTVYISGTAYGTKVFLGLLMADRLYVINQKREGERERIGFEQLAASELDEGSKDCLICQNALGIWDPESGLENPIKLTVCCGQIFGDSCLRTWLNELVSEHVFRDSCPNCRHQFSESFLSKLYDPEEYAHRVHRQIRHEEILLSPSPLPEPAPGTRTPIDLGIFEEDARRQLELTGQRQSPDEDIEMEG